MDNNFSIGNRIRELRNQKHLSQEQLLYQRKLQQRIWDRLKEMKRIRRLQ